MKAEEYTLVMVKQDTWEVWLPDEGGTCIGCATEPVAALRAAQQRLMNTAKRIVQDISLGHY